MNEAQERVDYHACIRSQAWYKRRWGALQRAKNRCQVCNSPDQLQAHHRDYSRLGKERPCDITILCSECHRLFSRYGRLVPAPQEVQS